MSPSKTPSRQRIGSINWKASDWLTGMGSASLAVLLAVMGQDFELYAAFDPLTDKVGAVFVVASCVRLVHRENIPTLPESDWSIVRISPHFLRLIGPS
eukprot:362332-Prorocentrum_minimum.AAC.1